MNRSATVRTTPHASEIESFIDENEENLSPVVFDLLDDLAGRIEVMEEEEQGIIEETESSLEDKEIELQEKNEEIAELENRVNILIDHMPQSLRDKLSL